MKNMEKRMIAITLLAFSFMLVVGANPATSSVNDIPCSEAVVEMMPCLPYLKSSEVAKPGLECCSSPKDVFSKATTTEGRRVLCTCFKVVAVKVGVIPEKAKQLPTLCDITIGVPIDPSVDCSKISV